MGTLPGIHRRHLRKSPCLKLNPVNPVNPVWFPYQSAFICFCLNPHLRNRRHLRKKSLSIPVRSASSDSKFVLIREIRVSRLFLNFLTNFLADFAPVRYTPRGPAAEPGGPIDLAAGRLPARKILPDFLRPLNPFRRGLQRKDSLCLSWKMNRTSTSTLKLKTH
jgi:hypothetical protein